MPGFGTRAEAFSCRAIYRRLIFFPIISLAILFLCSGCMREDLNGLLRLPMPADEYIELQKKIEEILSSGASYSAPLTGVYRQSVQLYDINGDGVNEALAFFATPGEKPLKIYIFEMNGGSYQTAAVIEGDGTGIESIAYIDMDSDGCSELVAGWKMAPDLQMLKIYKLDGFQPAVIATTDYTVYTTADLDRDGRMELLAVRHNRNNFTGVVDAYSINAQGETVSNSAHLSPGIENIVRLTTGMLYDGVPALFAEGVFKVSGVITDVFTFSDGVIKNISALRETGISSPVYRNYTVLCRDINSDGIMEIPVTSMLPSASEKVFFVFDWFAYNRWGTRRFVQTTYHNYSDSWYLILPPEWRSSSDDITIKREDQVVGERAVIFSRWMGEDDPPLDFLTIYRLTGENRYEHSMRDGRFLLRVEDEVIYAAELTVIDWEHMPGEQYVMDNFSIIYSEWLA